MARTTTPSSKIPARRWSRWATPTHRTSPRTLPRPCQACGCRQILADPTNRPRREHLPLNGRDLPSRHPLQRRPHRLLAVRRLKITPCTSQAWHAFNIPEGSTNQNRLPKSCQKVSCNIGAYVWHTLEAFSRRRARKARIYSVFKVVGRVGFGRVNVDQRIQSPASRAGEPGREKTSPLRFLLVS